MQIQVKTAQERLDEVIGELNAYRQGWISYDSEHVKALQFERVTLLAVLAV